MREKLLLCFLLLFPGLPGEAAEAPPLLGPVEGVVVARDCRRDSAGTRIYTLSTVRLAPGHEGANLPTRIVVRQLGGRVGEDRLTVIGAPLLRPGDRVRLTLLASGRAYYHPYRIVWLGQAPSTGCAWGAADGEPGAGRPAKGGQR